MNIKAFFNLSYGVYIIGAAKDGKYNAQIANTLFQVTAEPPQLAVAINKNNLTHEFISSSGYFSASVLEKDTPLKLIGKFGFKSGREINKFENINYKIINDIPVVTENTLSYFICKIKKQIDAGTHTVFIGEVIEAEVIKEGEPMSYAYYHQVKGGKTQKNAPTYIKKEKKMISGERYRCKICGYIYDPVNGDPDNGITPNTSFEDLPERWVCPICGAGKEEFEKVGD